MTTARSWSCRQAETISLALALNWGPGPTYDGPLSMATDMMVWNVRRDKIIERMAVSPDQAWEVPGPGGKLAPDRSRKSEYTDFIQKGRLDASDVNKRWLEEFMKENGLKPEDLKVGQ